MGTELFHVSFLILKGRSLDRLTKKRGDVK